MNITDLKLAIAKATSISLPTLMLSRQKNEEGVEQPWVSHWDNEKRVRISMHDDVANKIKSDPKFDGLAFKRETVPATSERAEYQRFIVITPTSVVFTF